MRSGSYEALRRILDNPKVKRLNKLLRVKDADTEDGINYKDNLITHDNLPVSDFLPDNIIAIDGSYLSVPAKNGFPGAEFGYITVASVIIKLDEVNKQAQEDFIDPKKFRETEKSGSVDCVIPGCNVVIEDEKSAKSSMRQALFDSLKSTSFRDGETLLETYEWLLKIKLTKDENDLNTRKPRSPIEDFKDKDMSYDYGTYICPHSKEQLYSTDAMRLHELLNPSGSSGEMYGQIKSMLEKLLLINVLRMFERKKWLPLLSNVAFVLDGPLACFSTWSWLNKSIIEEISRINTLQKQTSKKDMLIIGVERSGAFVNHFEEIDVSAKGYSDNFPKQSAFLLKDDYIKKNIILSESKKPYGQDTYFGRKFFYKSKDSHKIVPVVATFDQSQQNLETAEPKQFPRLSDIINLIDNITSTRYPNSLSPLVSVYEESAIPFNLGKRIFEDIAKKLQRQDD